MTLSKPHTGTNLVPATPRNGVPSRAVLVTRSLSRRQSDAHIVPSVTHKLRTVHEMRDTRCRACILNSFVVTSRDTLEIIFLTFQNFRPHRHALLHLARIATHSQLHTVTSSSDTGMPNCVPRRKPFVAPVWGLLHSFTARNAGAL